MHIFRIFTVSVLIPLISVGLCATGDSKKHSRNVIIKEYPSPRHLDGPNSTVHFPSKAPENDTKITSSINPRKGTTDSLPNHPHPLKIDVVSIKNSTRVHDDYDPYIVEGRGIYSELETLHWIWNFLWKAISSYAIVAIINLLLTPVFQKFGWNGPYWSGSVKLGNEGPFPSAPILTPSIKKLRVSFGHEGSSKKEEHDDGWGWPSPQHGGGGGHGGHGGQALGANFPGGWSSLLSYDQYALALPYVDKYSQKAAKKSAKYAKKANKYAQKASRYAAKAQAYRNKVKPLHATGWINPAAAVGLGGVPGVPGAPHYGYGR